VSALDGDAEALRLLAGLDVPVLLVGDVTWDPAWSDRVPLPLDAPMLEVAARTAAWDAHLAEDRLVDGTLSRGPPAARAGADRPRRPVGAAQRVARPRCRSTSARCRRVPGRRTRPASSACPGGWSRASAGTTWC
jgi:hypothetical protein